MRADCPVCGDSRQADEDGTFWCERDELAWFPWTWQQEASRLADKHVAAELEELTV